MTYSRVGAAVLRNVGDLDVTAGQPEVAGQILLQAGLDLLLVILHPRPAEVAEVQLRGDPGMMPNTRSG